VLGEFFIIHKNLYLYTLNANVFGQIGVTPEEKDRGEGGIEYVYVKNFGKLV
jgi:hypothetical protein